MWIVQIVAAVGLFAAVTLVAVGLSALNRRRPGLGTSIAVVGGMVWIGVGLVVAVIGLLTSDPAPRYVDEDVCLGLPSGTC